MDLYLSIITRIRSNRHLWCSKCIVTPLPLLVSVLQCQFSPFPVGSSVVGLFVPWLKALIISERFCLALVAGWNFILLLFFSLVLRYSFHLCFHLLLSLFERLKISVHGFSLCLLAHAEWSPDQTMTTWPECTAWFFRLLWYDLLSFW